MPKIHPRVEIVSGAETKIREAMHDATSELSSSEAISVVTRCASEYIQSICKYAIREERHGNVDKPGGWA